jgi:hypothetical protein
MHEANPVSFSTRSIGIRLLIDYDIVNAKIGHTKHGQRLNAVNFSALNNVLKTGKNCLPANWLIFKPPTRTGSRKRAAPPSVQRLIP